MSYKLYTYNQSILLNNICFNISDSLLGDSNNDLHFDKFILNYQVINYKSFLDETRDMNDIKNLYIDNNFDEFLIEQIPE